MLESALFCRRALHFLELMELNYKHYPTVAEWGKLEKIENSWLFFIILLLSFLIPNIQQPTYSSHQFL